MTAAAAPIRADFWGRLFDASRVIHWRNLPVVVVLGIGAVLMFLPFLWMFASSMRPAGEAYRLPPSFIPDRLHLAAYREVLDSPVPFLRMYWNSLVVATVTTLGVIINSTMAAFAFSRLDFPGKHLLFGLLLLGLMVPPSLLLIPLFFGFAATGLLDTLWALILPATASPLGVYMMRQFMLNQPPEYEEAAFVDGAGYWTIFTRISLPQLGPPIAALSIITFTQSWNNFAVPLVLVRKLETMTLPVGLLSISDQFGDFSFAALMAAVSMAVIPLFVVFLVAQRFIIEGVTSSGLKG
ncbi:MAG: carbohydrate ABC transporter permease [Lautropia sp.]